MKSFKSSEKVTNSSREKKASAKNGVVEGTMRQNLENIILKGKLSI